MASRGLTQRFRAEPTAAASGSVRSNKQTKKFAMARRGLRSLAIAVAVPVVLTVFTIYVFGSRSCYRRLAKPSWYPPLWMFHLSSLSTASIMGLSAWLVWAEGGFHQETAALPLYLAQLLLGLAWPPVFFRSGSTRLGLGLCISLFVALYGCSKTFKRVNPIAGDLVKPCLAWAGFLGLMNYRLL